jgi:tRNA threonylcarbamoyladenosine biosynthesis protein TsaE
MKNLFSIEMPLASEIDTLALGKQIAPVLQKSMVIYLLGDLGAGKTTLVRGILKQLGELGSIKSPTYTLVESYATRFFTIHHFDLYRFQNPCEWDDLGLNDFFSDHTLCLIEWPEKAVALLPPPDWKISLLWVPYGSRTAKISAFSNLGESCLKKATTSFSVG